MSNLVLGKFLGRGRFGEVYMGEWNYHKVAIKKFFLSDEQLIQQEIDIIKNLRSKYIIQFYSVEIYDKSIVMITDYAENGNLATVLKNQHIDWKLRWRITDNIIRGLAFLHSNNIVHRDLKSLNILINKYYEAKLCDFGLAELKIKTSSTMTLNNGIGTLRWMAPELFSLKPQYSFKSDVYSLGMVMWEIATRKTVPFSDVQENLIIIQYVKSGEREEIPEDIPYDYANMIKQCWNQNPDDRPMAHELINNATTFDDKIATFDEEISMNISKLEIKENTNYHDSTLTESNDINAMLSFGDMYYFGHGVEKDYKKAFEWFTKPANPSSGNGLGNSFAQNSLGHMYYFGNRVKKDYKKAFEWYTKSAEQGNSNGQYNLGNMYQYGYYVKKDYKKAVEWYTKSAEQGNPIGQDNLGNMYYTGYGVEKDYKKAFEWYTKSAEQGNSNAQYSLGNMYSTGYGVEKDYKKAFELYTKSAEQGNSNAQNDLGYMYKHGYHVEKDYKKAFEWYTKSAEQGNSTAQNNLGDMYYNGYYVEKDDKKAFEWFTKSAEQGNSNAQNWLGYMYEHRYYVEKDDKKAFKWYKKSAEQGNSRAQMFLENMYYVEKDDKKSIFKFFR